MEIVEIKNNDEWNEEKNMEIKGDDGDDRRFEDNRR